MKIQVLTLFPNLFGPFKELGLVGRACERGLVTIEPVQIRDYAINTQGQVDDTPYGGGSGMILRPEPAIAAIEQAKSRDPKASVALFTPRGSVFTQALAHRIFSSCAERGGGLILLCPRYEGVDERITNWVDYELSLGDFILMGGEAAAMAFIETVTRFIPGVLGNPESLAEESFESGLLEYPQYTKPQTYRGHAVPPVLLTGHHENIAKWRKAQSWEDTSKRRPDLIRRLERRKAKVHLPQVEAAASDIAPSPAPKPFPCELDVALIHYPVLNKEGKIITSSVTNLDLHDIARSSRTYGITRFYIVHPVKAMRKLLSRVCDHWAKGFGYTYNPNRSEALENLLLLPHFDDIIFDIEERTERFPKLIATSARMAPDCLSFKEMSSVLRDSTEPHLILLGTGWGLAPEILERADYRLEPILGPTEYNHLSVRSAAAIILDRLYRSA